MGNKVINLGEKRNERNHQQTKEALREKFKEHFPLLTSHILVGRFERLIEFSPDAGKILFDSVEKTKQQDTAGIAFNRYARQFEFFNSVFYSIGTGVMAGIENVLTDFEKNPQIDPRDVLLNVRNQVVKLNALLQDNPLYNLDDVNGYHYTLSCAKGDTITPIDPIHLEDETLIIIGVVVNDHTHHKIQKFERTVAVPPTPLEEQRYEIGGEFWFCQFSLEVELTDEATSQDNVTVHGGLEYNPTSATVVTRSSSDDPSLVTVEALIVERGSRT